MARRHRRTDFVDKPRILAAIEALRDAVGPDMRNMIIHGEIYRAATAAWEANKRLARAVSGDPNLYSDFGHSIAPLQSAKRDDDRHPDEGQENP